MLASPFFTAGRTSILPAIATRQELHAANSLTQTTQWTTLAIGAFLGGTSVMQFGYSMAFLGNALSFLASALCIAQLYLPGTGFVPPRKALTETEVVRPWHEYVEGLRYMRSVPLIFALRWSMWGGRREAARRRSSSASSARSSSTAARRAWEHLGMRRDRTPDRRSAGVHPGAAAQLHQLQAQHRYLLRRARRKLHPLQPGEEFLAGPGAHCALAGGRGVQLGDEHVAPLAERVERISGTGIRHPGIDHLDGDAGFADAGGRGFADWDPRTIGALAGALSSTTAFFWGWANWRGRLPEPALEGVEPEEIEVHGEPTT